MKVTIDSMLIIRDITPEQQAIILNDNTYPNPAYNQAIEMGYRTWKIDKEITTYQNEEGCIIVPRGYLHKLPDHELINNRTTIDGNIPPLKDITLRKYQTKSINDALEHEQGIIQAGTGSGKTIIGLKLIQKIQQKALILIHSKELMTQWQGQIKKLLGVDCGLVGDGKNTQNIITICMLQTLNKRPVLLKELSNNYGLVIVDECHHIPSKTFSKVINHLACKYRYGLTATPTRRDGLHELIFRHIGDTISQVPDSAVHEVGGIVPITVKRIDTNCYYQVDSWQDYIKELTEDHVRNSLIISIAEKASKKVSTLILTDRVEHAERLASMTDCLLIHGQLSMKIRKERMQSITDHSLIIGTTGLLGEGLDISGWTALILVTPISSKVKLLQAIGRVMRTHKGKQTGYVADLVDQCGFSLSSYKKRLAIYQEKGFSLC